MSIIDQQARKDALNPTQSFIVQAPAGSGKTELLTQRVLSLLANAVQQPEEVLAITFTRKAAEEMRLRVMDALMLGQQIEMPSMEHKRHTWALARKVIAKNESANWNLLQNPQRLQIMTIDAFCASIAKQMPVLSRMGAVPKVTKQPWLLYKKAAQCTINDLLAQDDESIKKLLLHLDNQQNKAVDEIARMLQYREQWLSLVLHQQRHDAKTYLEENIKLVITACINKTAEIFPMQLWQDLHALVSFSLQHVKNDELQQVLQWQTPAKTLDTISGWQALVNWLLTTNGTVRKSPDKRMGFPAGKDKNLKLMKNEMKLWLRRLDEQPELVACLQQIAILPPTEYHIEQWQVLQALFDILPVASAQLLLQFQQHAQVDFSAIAQSALHALGGIDDPSDLTLKLDNKISHILVDEFQDTSFLQFELLEKLLAGWQNDDARTLFLVGDPMQSIYRFRQAQVGLFLQAQEQGIAGVKLQPLTLQMNFRSKGAFINWLNKHAPQCFAQKSDTTLGAITYSPSTSMHNDNTDCVFAHSSENTEEQAEQVVLMLEKLQDKEAIESVAVLVRARTHLLEITEKLSARELPYQAIELEPLAQRPIAQHLLALTRAYINLNDAITWLSVLGGPLVGLNLADLTRLREKNKHQTVFENIQQIPDEISAEAKRILNRVAPVLVNALQQKQRLSLAASVKSLWICLGGPAYAQTQDALQDAQVYFDLLAENEQGGTLIDEALFLQQLELTFSKPQLANTKIQVMTIHRAKGLEFDAVLIPGLERRAPASEKPLLLWDNLPTANGEALLFAPIHATQSEVEPIYEYLWAVQKQKGSYELGRLLYVALTRAKSQLHLFAVIDEEAKAPVQGSLLSLLWPSMENAFMPLLQSTAKQKPKDKIVLTRLSPAWQWPSELPALHLDLAIDASRGNHVSPDICNLKRLRDQAIGTVLHSALYHQQGNKQSWHMHLLELGVCEDIAGALETIEQAWQSAQLDAHGQWILSAQQEANAEYAILARHDKEFARIIIDKTFVDEHDVRWIIDYKTSHPGDIPLEEFYRQMQAQYAPQLERYAAILAQQESRPIKLGLYFPLFAGWHEWKV